MENNPEKKPKKRKKRKSFILVTLILLTLCFTAYLLIYFFMPNFRHLPLYSYFADLQQDKVYIVLKDNRIELENYPIKENDVIYLPVDFVKEYIDEYILWDNEVKKLTITTENKVIRMNTNELNYLLNNKSMTLNLPVHEINGIAYMPESLLEELYNVSIEYSDEYKMTTVDYNNEAKKIGTVEKANLRYEPNIKSVIESKLLNEDLVIYDTVEDFTKVRTQKGLIGYIETSKIVSTQDISPIIVEETKIATKIPIEGKINLVWDLITNPDANTNEEKKEKHLGVNVLSPTWFKFDLDKKNGDLINIADKSYVDQAHRNGYQIWALISDDKASVGYDILSNTEYREHVINQLLAFISIYDLDGINIDFEQITPDTTEYFLQFLRELSPLLKEQNVVLSVDMYVPLYTKYYNRTEVAKVVDYVCVMAYDEHTGTNAGPVASYAFVAEGITETMKEVPREKILMGIPFYSRIWKNGTRIAEYGRNRTIKEFTEKGAQFEWQEDLKLYYATYTVTEEGEEAKYEVWLEDERAIAEKMQIFNEYDLAGVASWARGLGNELFYDVINENLNIQN